jgi:hypothetical protein
VDTLGRPNVSALREAVEAQRVRVGMTFDALAVTTGLDRRTVIRLLREDQTRGGTIDSWWRLCRALGVDLADLAGLLNEPQDDPVAGVAPGPDRT